MEMWGEMADTRSPSVAWSPFLRWAPTAKAKRRPPRLPCSLVRLMSPIVGGWWASD